MRRREVLIGIKSQLRAWKVRVSGCVFKGWWGEFLPLKVLKIPEDKRMTRSFGIKSLSDANTPKYTGKKPTKDYISTIEGETSSSFAREKVQN